MKNKTFLVALFASAIIILVVLTAVGNALLALHTAPSSSLVSLKKTSQTIGASGSIHSQNEVTLHFLTAGKVTYVPFKQGDVVQQGQTIAQLDTYPLQKQLAAALNTYRSTRDTFDQTQDNSQNNVLFGAQRYSIEVFNKSGITTGDVENNIINDMAKRIVDQNQATLDNSVINVELSQYALQLASLTAPFTGVLTEEDVTVPNVNVTPATSFSLADPNAKIFRANVDPSDIDFVSLGAAATIRLDGQNATVKGTVVKIYPQKQTLPNGDAVYQVDIQSDALNAHSIFGQSGSVLIDSNATTAFLMVPSWTIVGHSSVWIWDGKNAVLKSVVVGQAHGDMTEIVSGLSDSDRVITSPNAVARKTYSLL